MYTLPGGLMQAVLLAEAAGVVVAAGGAAAAGSGVMRERRWPALWCAALLVLGAAMAIVYAGEADPYFFPRRSRWDFGGVGGRAFLVGAVAFSVPVVALLVVDYGRRRRPSRPRARGFIAAALGLALLIVAFYALSIGH